MWRKLLNAVYDKDADAVRELLNGGADPNAKDHTGCSLLFKAAASTPEILDLFLEHGADVDLAVEGRGGGNTLLHAAVRFGENCKTLIDLGFDVNTRDDYGNTPLSFAAAYGSPDAIDVLLDAGSDIESADEFGDTPLHKAVIENRYENAVLLIKRGADVNSRDTEGMTPLHAACKSKYQGITKIAKLLVSAGADLGATDKRGRTPYGLACDWERKRMMKFLEGLR